MNPLTIGPSLKTTCVAGVASNISLVYALMPLKGGAALATPKVDIGGLHFVMDIQHLPQLLYFKAVWLDHIKDLAPVEIAADAMPDDIGGPDASRVSDNLSLIGIVRVRSLSAECAISNNIGTVILKAEDFTSTFKKVPRDSKSVQIALRKVSLSAKSGRLGGAFTSEALRYNYTFRDVWEQVGRSADRCVDISAHIGTMVANAKIDHRVIAIVQADPIDVLVTDDWSQSLAEERKVNLLFWTKLSTLAVVTTAETPADLQAMRDQLFHTIKEKRDEADLVLQRLRSDRANHKVIRDNVAQALAVTKPSPLPSDTVVVCDLRLEAEAIRLFIFKNSLMSNDLICVEATAVRATLTRVVGHDHRTSRDLKLELGKFSIAHLSPVKLYNGSDQEPRDDNIQYLRSLEHEDLLRWPPTSIQMNSIQEAGSNDIRHSFTLRFRGAVHIGTKFDLAVRMRELKPVYVARMQFHRLQAQMHTFAGDPTTSVDAGTDGSKELSKGERDDHSGNTAPQGLPPGADEAFGRLNFIGRPGEIHIDQPQLVVLQDRKRLLPSQRIRLMRHCK